MTYLIKYLFLFYWVLNFFLAYILFILLFLLKLNQMFTATYNVQSTVRCHDLH